MRRLFYRVGLALSVLLAAPFANSQNVESLVEGLTATQIASVAGGAVRLAHDRTTNDFYYVTVSGDLYHMEPPYSSGTLVATRADYGIASRVLGMTVGPDGTVYIVGDDIVGTTLVARIVSGVLEDETWSWSSVARTEPYPRSATAFDHRFNAIVVSQDGNSLIVNSGSRTEHGEVQDNGGAFPGLRETAITSAILQIPINADDLVLEDDSDFLETNGYLLADGVRNTFDLAFDTDGNLYGSENSGDRDDGEELNRIVQGNHYGFPWRMGTNDTPQQFPGYDPDMDVMLNPASNAYQMGFFYDDPSYPAPPVGVKFTDPVISHGPDADHFRDESDGLIYDASDLGTTMSTLTPHRSPLGLLFDVDSELPGHFVGDGFLLSWTSGDVDGAPLLIPFGDASQDLLHLEFANPDEMNATRIVSGFSGPIDAVQVGDKIYVLENGPNSGLWSLDFSGVVSNESEQPRAARLSVFPNPAAAGTTVRLELIEPGSAKVFVYDLLGRLIVARSTMLMTAGRHDIHLDTSSLSPGTYFVRVESDGQSQTRQISVIR